MKPLHWLNEKVRTMTEIIFFIVFSGFLIAAAISDFSHLKVPNTLCACLAAAGLGAVWMQGPGALAVAMGIGLSVFLVGWVLFALGIMGGGDGKLMAATAIWLSPVALADFAVLIALFGGALAILILVVQRSQSAQVYLVAVWMERLAAPRPPVPYAIAIAPAGILAFMRHPHALT